MIFSIVFQSKRTTIRIGFISFIFALVLCKVKPGKNIFKKVKYSFANLLVMLSPALIRRLNHVSDKNSFWLFLRSFDFGR